ncbi:23S rRNA (guanosine(2251)-2'-O)-methyltransferase RlmB [Spiroplasma clarkii]|uniref:23S rRNA (guanosine(2251)-2'-O)-methyltransferase RlmB n=1 Tax=Spiroplasma clarkii TaxID=2139 RepID=UPI0021501358|nr:23S rRNA (guanosine(2251)-2'-O)-methyltransferase RlmB [Spiroplasma clarkii]
MVWESVDKHVLSTLFKEKVAHQGYAAEINEFKFSHIKDIIANDNQKHIILMLDRLQDPHNFGSIIRTASLLGIDGIVIQEHDQVGVTPAVYKVSAGTVYDTPIVKVANLSNAIRELKDNGYWIYATTLDEDAVDIQTLEFAKKTVLVVGNEGDGVMKKIQNNSDVKIKISTTNAIDSLNVSVATGILLYYVINQ